MRMRNLFWAAVLAALTLGVVALIDSEKPAQLPERATFDVGVSQPTPTSVADPVGLVGVLQGVGSTGLVLQTKDGLQTVVVGQSTAIDQLQIGDTVAVWGLRINGRIVVTKIVLVPQSPVRTHYVGLITAITADHFEVVGLQGELTAFRFDSTLQKLPVGYQPAVGDKVTVVAKPDPLGEGWMAVAIVKQ